MDRVIVLDPLAREGLELLDAAEGVEYDVRTGLSGDALRTALEGYDAAICRSGVTITADALRGNRRLKAIVRAGVGTDNIDQGAATRQGIIIMNTPSGNTISTAEHTFALMLGLARNIAAADRSLREGKWNRKDYMGSQLEGKTLGIVGLGRVGREVARRALAFGMRVIGYDPFLSDEKASQLGIEPVSKLRDMLPRVDFLTVHTPLTAETRNLISMEELELLRPGVRLINCARGGIFNEEALLAGLKSGRLAGVALDVYQEEPCTQSPLFQALGTLCTPHLGASTEEAQTQVAIEAAQLVINFLSCGEIRHAVNAAAIDPQTLDLLRGHLNLAYRLGMLLAQWHQGAPHHCVLTYRGEVAARDTRLLTAAFSAGLLERAMDEQVNIVNAEMLMRERGIETVVEASTELGAFSSSIKARLSSAAHTVAAAGTLFGTGMPRLIRLNDFRLEAYLDGILLLFTHQDVPGIIGSVGTLFGNHKINIAQMAVGRAGNQPGGAAIGVLNLDSRPADAVIQELVRLPHIHSATVVELPPTGHLPPWLV
jgi:D-3-phosphoglycerate dehydrogenase